MNDTNPPEPFPAEEARKLLEKAIPERLGEDWDDERDGWIIISRQDYAVRLSRGRKNIDFYVDLLGEVIIKESDVVAGEDAGRLVAWIFLLASLFIALLIARFAGIL